MIVTACLLVGLTYHHPAVVNASLRLVEVAQVSRRNPIPMRLLSRKASTSNQH